MPRELEPAVLGHTHLYVRSLERSAGFYARVFGLEESERIGDAMVFFAGSGRHHVLALQALGESAGPPIPGRVGLYHVAFELPDAAALEAALARLDRESTPFQAVDHGISWAVYFDDPDGNGLELYVDRRDHPDGRRRWGGVSRPLSCGTIRRAAAGPDASEDPRGG